jgi:RimJ/RimL family protein N-acetyltransferase
MNADSYPNGYGIFSVVAAGEVIGEAGLFNSFGNNKVLEFGYIIDEKFWNKGYGTEVCKALLDYGFNRLNLEKIVARMYPENIGSVRVCENLNFVKVDVPDVVYHQYEIVRS